jgi:hypothetical protein
MNIAAMRSQKPARGKALAGELEPINGGTKSASDTGTAAVAIGSAATLPAAPNGGAAGATDAAGVSVLFLTDSNAATEDPKPSAPIIMAASNPITGT